MFCQQHDGYHRKLDSWVLGVATTTEQVNASLVEISTGGGEYGECWGGTPPIISESVQNTYYLGI